MRLAECSQSGGSIKSQPSKIVEDDGCSERSQSAARCSVGRSVLWQRCQPSVHQPLAVCSSAAGAVLLSEPPPQRASQRAHRHKECKRIAQGQVARRKRQRSSRAEEAATSPHEALHPLDAAPGPSAARTAPAARGLAPQLLGRRLRRSVDGRRRPKAEAAGHAARLREAELPRATESRARSRSRRARRRARSRQRRTKGPK